jgi:uncharacterized phage infection (PIP) family protein YhgE
MEAMELSLEQIDRISDHVATKLQLVQKQAETDSKFEKIILQLEHQRELMEKGFGQIDKRFEQVDKRFEQVDKRFEQVDKRFEQVDRRFEQVDQRFDRQTAFFKWQLGILLSLTMGIYLKLFGIV